MLEVLIALALLGGLVVSGVSVRGRVVRGLAADSVRADAVDAADHLLSEWWGQSDTAWRPGVPRAGRGSVPVRGPKEGPGGVPLRWQTEAWPMVLDEGGVRPPTGATRGGARLERVRLTLWAEGAGRSPVYAVEVLLPARPAPAARRGGGR